MSQVATIRREPSIPTLNAADLNWLIGQYISWQRTQLDNQATVDCYACKLRWFTAWWEEVGPCKEWLLHQSDLEAFERHLREVVSARTKRRLSWHSRNDVLRRLREMFHWATSRDYTERDYAEWIPKADGGPPKRRAVPITSLIKLLSAAGNSTHAARDRCMLAMMMGMGLRRIEVVNLNVEDVVIEADSSGYAHVTGKRTKANKTGERDAAFDAATGKVIAAYLDASDATSGPLFRNAQGHRLSAMGVYRSTKALIEEAGLEDEVQACHDLRRAFTTYAARHRKGTDAADRLRRQLGHASYSQTAEYALLDVEDLRVDFISPLAVMSDGVLGLGHTARS
jgi:site-specific recombinase XerD